MMCCVPFRPDTPLIAFLCTPALIAVGPLSYEDLWYLIGFETRGYSVDDAAWVAASILGALAYGVAGIILTIRAVTGFNAAVDRPRRTWPDSKARRKARDAAEL
jgi:hypothetical protein